MKVKLLRKVKDHKDLKYTWICSGCDAFFRTAEEKKPKKCPECKVPAYFIYRYYSF